MEEQVTRTWERNATLQCSLVYYSPTIPCPPPQGSWIEMQLMEEGYAAPSKHLWRGRGPTACHPRPISSFLGCDGTWRPTAPTQRLAAEHFGDWTRQERPFFLALKAFGKGELTPRPGKFSSKAFLVLKSVTSLSQQHPCGLPWQMTPPAICKAGGSHHPPAARGQCLGFTRAGQYLSSSPSSGVACCPRRGRWSWSLPEMLPPPSSWEDRWRGRCAQSPE